MYIKAVRRKTGMVFFFAVLLGSMQCFAQDEPPAVNDKKLDVELSELPGDLLIALGKKARAEGQYHLGIRMFQTALQSPYGEREFMDGLKTSLKKVNHFMEQEAGVQLVPYFKGTKPRDILEITVKEIDPQQKNQNRARKFQIDTRILLKETIPEGVYAAMSQRSADLLARELKQLYPQNPLVFTSHRNMYFLEGYFNAEYPAIIPQAHYELGLLYQDYQDFKMAEIHFDLAIKNKDFFPSREMLYAAQYEQARLYLYAGKLNLYENILKDIVQSQDLSAYSGLDGAVLSRKLKKLFLDSPDGMDKVLSLYRLPDDFSREAHYLLGRYYLERNDNENALPHLLFSVLQVASTLIEELRKSDPGFKYLTLYDLLKKAESEPEFKEYLGKCSIYESMYALATAALGYQAGRSTAGTNIMKSLAKLPAAGEYNRKARRFLE